MGFRAGFGCRLLLGLQVDRSEASGLIALVVETGRPWLWVLGPWVRGRFLRSLLGLQGCPKGLWEGLQCLCPALLRRASNSELRFLTSKYHGAVCTIEDA